MKLIQRYNLVNLPILAATFILSGLFLYFNIHRLLISNFDDSLREQAQYITRFAVKNHRLPIQSFTDEWKINYTKIFKKNTTTNFEYIDYYEPDENEKTRYRQLSYALIISPNIYRVAISKSLEALDGLSESIAVTTILSLFVTIAITLLTNQFTLNKLWKPFYRTLALLKEFRLGKEQNISFSKTSTEEFNFMNVQLSRMIMSAEKDYLNLKEFTDNASHELQTPISIIRSKLDIILQGENLDFQQSQALEDAYQSVSRMANLGKSLLLLSKIENMQFNERSYINLKQKLEEKILQLEEYWLVKEIKLKSSLKEASLTINPELLDILLNNVLSNASKHNIAFGELVIFLTENKLIISNSGEAVEIDPNRIYSRFYKQVKSSNNNGLGLSIIKQICIHSGITVQYTFNNNMHSFTFDWD